MTLFHDMERTDLSVAEYSDSSYGYLDRSARPEFCRMRAVFEEWFSRYPEVYSAALRQRFRDTDDTQHRSAFFELLLHEVLLRLGCHVTIPDSPGASNTRNPDFHAKAEDGTEFFLEATLVTEEPPADRANQAIVARLYDDLNSAVQSPDFFLSVTVSRKIRTSPPSGRIAKDLTRWLASLDADQVSRRCQAENSPRLPSRKYVHEGCVLRFEAIPKAPHARGKPGLLPIGMTGPGEAVWVESPRAIARKVIDKGNAYGRMDLPYVVAVNALGDYADESHFIHALFGAYAGASTATFARRRRISAVLGGVRIWPSHVTRGAVRLYRNPWARCPYEDVLARFPQVMRQGEEFVTGEGTSLAELLGLPPRWPEE